MRKYSFGLIVLVAFFTTSKVFGQTKSCCQTSANKEFAMLGSDNNFQSAHLSPEPINFVSESGSTIKFPVSDGKEGNAFLIKSITESNNYLFIFHEWWGLNDYIKKEAENYSKDFPDVTVLAIDLYDGQIATNAEDAGKLMQSIQQERAAAIIKGALSYVGAKAAVQTIGWCFGGGWSLQATLLLGSQAKGCIMYYGMPEKDADKLSDLNAPVLGIFASHDNWITKPLVEEFQATMKTLNKQVTINWFDAEHAFANPSNPQFDKEATAKARGMAVEFLSNQYK